MSSISRVHIKEANIIHDLGHACYYATYSAILPHEQVEFMLGRNYSVEALQEAMSNGQDFFLLSGQDQEPLGFIALQDEGTSILRIEKLYLLRAAQGRGFGKKMIDFAVDQAIQRNKSMLELNVNRKNTAYHFYLKQGFEVKEEEDIPYFGYVLDDYVMQRSVF